MAYIEMRNHWTIRAIDYQPIQSSLPDKQKRDLVKLFCERPFTDFEYEETLKAKGIQFHFADFRKHVKAVDMDVLRAMMTSIVRRERFNEGLIEIAYLDGILYEILKEIEERIS